MSRIINPDKDLMKRKRYACVQCHKRYDMSKLELINIGSKCKKCGGELRSLDPKVY